VIRHRVDPDYSTIDDMARGLWSFHYCLSAFKSNIGILILSVQLSVMRRCSPPYHCIVFSQQNSDLSSSLSMVTLKYKWLIILALCRKWCKTLTKLKGPLVFSTVFFYCGFILSTFPLQNTILFTVNHLNANISKNNSHVSPPFYYAENIFMVIQCSH